MITTDRQTFSKFIANLPENHQVKPTSTISMSVMQYSLDGMLVAQAIYRYGSSIYQIRKTHAN